jgi:hypothetical protein
MHTIHEAVPVGEMAKWTSAIVYTVAGILNRLARVGTVTRSVPGVRLMLSPRP